MGDLAPLATQPDVVPDLAPAPVTAPPAHSPGPAPARGPAWLIPACAALATLAVMLWRIGVPSLWRDEGATLSAAHRSFPQLIRMLGHLDAVHGTYYLLIWLLVRVAGRGELALRLPSAVAMAAAAGLLTALGRRLVSPAAGLAAGLAFAAIPAVSWFGQDARPFALETAAATAASYCFARFLGDGAARWARWYTVSLIGLGLADIFGLLLIAAHGTTLLMLHRQHGRQDGRQLARRWLATVTVAVLALLPLEVLAWSQRGQVSWLRTPLAASLANTGRLRRHPGRAADRRRDHGGRAGRDRAGRLVPVHRGLARPAGRAGPALAARTAGPAHRGLPGAAGVHVPLHRVLRAGRGVADRRRAGRAGPGGQARPRWC